MIPNFMHGAGLPLGHMALAIVGEENAEKPGTYRVTTTTGLNPPDAYVLSPDNDGRHGEVTKPRPGSPCIVIFTHVGPSTPSTLPQFLHNLSIVLKEQKRVERQIRYVIVDPAAVTKDREVSPVGDLRIPILDELLVKINVLLLSGTLGRDLGNRQANESIHPVGNKPENPTAQIAVGSPLPIPIDNL